MPDFGTYIFSDQVFNRLMSDDFVTSEHSQDIAHRQRERLIKILRTAIENDGHQLASQSNDIAFSKHGSLFQRTMVGNANSSDIDMYVALNSNGYRLEDGEIGKGPYPNKNNPKLLSNPSFARKWMKKIVINALPENTTAVVKSSKRGVRLSNYGNPKRKYDIIPSFLFKDRDNYVHLIPNGNEWEWNPTVQDMSDTIYLGNRFSRDKKNKILGFRDIIKAFKYVASERNLKDSHGINSFVLCLAVTFTYNWLAQSYYHSFETNHIAISKVLEKLNSWIYRGYVCDPYTGKRINFNSHEILTISNFYYLLGV